MKLLLSTFALLSSTLALPSPPILKSPQFNLKFYIFTPSNPSFHNFYLSSYHIHPAFDYAVLVTNTTQDSGIVGYLNGTAAEFAEWGTTVHQ